MDADRLRVVRIRSRLTTVIRMRGVEGIERALTRDIGISGICLLTEGPLKIGARLDVELALPDRPTPIAFAGEVVWSKPIDRAGADEKESTVESGIKFVTINPKERELLMQWVALNALHPSLGDR